MESFSYSKIYKTGDKVRSAHRIYMAIRDVPKGIIVKDSYFWKVVDDDGEGSDSNVHSRNPVGDDGGLLVGALDIFSSVGESAGDAASSVLDCAGGMFGGAGGIGID